MRCSYPMLRIGLMCIAIALFTSNVMAEHYDVLILAGQSNMDGRGKKSQLIDALAPFAKPQADVLISYSNSTIRGPYTSDGWKPLQPGYSVPPGAHKAGTTKPGTLTSGATKPPATKPAGEGKPFHLPGNTFGPEVSFGRALADGMAHFTPARHIALIKFSEGGTSLHKDWDLDKKGALYEQFLAFVRKSLKELTDRGDTYTIVAIAWHQGESDASLSAEAYQALLTKFIQRIRTDLATPNLPFLIGEVYDNQKRDTIRKAQQSTSHDVPNTFLVTVEGLLTSDQGTHFDTPSQIKLGQRFAEAALRAMKSPVEKK